MKKDSSNERKNDDPKKSNIYEEVKRNNLMDWGVIELGESVQQNETRKK